MDVIIDIAALVLLGGLLISWLWRRNIANKARSWPIAEAVIESGTIETVARERFSKVDLPVFSFSYRVGEEYFGGRFALLPYITDPGESVVQRMIGRKLQIRYDPRNPELWFVPDELIEGCRVEQKISPHIVNLKPAN